MRRLKAVLSAFQLMTSTDTPTNILNPTYGMNREEEGRGGGGGRWWW